jgi:hypothetical protein
MNRFVLCVGILATISQSVSLPVNAGSPIPSGKECDAALSTAKSNLLRIKDLKIVKVAKSDLRQRVNEQEIPKGRSQDVTFNLTGRGAKNFMHSPKLMTAISANLINNCKSTASITYGYDRTDVFQIYGIFQDGTIQAFKCISPRQAKPGTKSAWGTQLCL